MIPRGNWKGKMASWGYPVVVILTTLTFYAAPASAFRLEAEEFGNSSMIRSNASGEESVLLFQGDHLELTFCISETGFVEIANILYTNDGQGDDVAIGIDGHMTGHFTTPTYLDGGRGWNYIRSVKSTGVIRKLFPGYHVVNILVLYADSFGVEVDAVDLRMLNENPGSSAFGCSVFCFRDIDYKLARTPGMMPLAKFVQKSNSTVCAEEKNIRVEVYHDTATAFSVKALHPKYPSFSNDMEPNLTNCGPSDIVWEFQDVDTSRVQNIKSLMTNVTIGKTPSGIKMEIIFRLDNTERTHTSPHGSVLKIIRRGSNKKISISMQYKVGASNWTIPQTRFTRNGSELAWHFPDKTWAVNKDNKIAMHWLSSPLRNTLIESIRLKFGDDQRDALSIYRDKFTLVEGISYYSSPGQSERMTVSTVGGNFSSSDMDCLHVSFKVSWAVLFSKVFVLCKDGRLKITPMVPHGLDEIPATSTLLISRSDYLIRQVIFNPSDMSFSVKYANNIDNIEIRLNHTSEETEVVLTYCSWSINRKLLPVLVYESMWVENGNADVDHMTVDGGKTRHIMTKWGEIYGMTGVFFRRCISRHNTLGPDMMIQVLSHGKKC